MKLIKLIFLFIFLSTLVIVLSAQNNYYDNKNADDNSKNLHSLEKLQSGNNIKN
jgi:1,4-dihydroxy-2-naphthoate octaprenyltransferase